MTAPYHWDLRMPNANAVRDSRGYLIDPKPTHDESTWKGRMVKILADANEKTLERQRQMGYKVYDGDPGDHPINMSHHEQSVASGPLYEAFCTIL